jgi:hypothetical protein
VALVRAETRRANTGFLGDGIKSRRLRTISLESAIGGIALSLLGVGFASLGYLTPVPGAIAQEVIDVVAVVNAPRVALPTEIPVRLLTDPAEGRPGGREPTGRGSRDLKLGIAVRPPVHHRGEIQRVGSRR